MCHSFHYMLRTFNFNISFTCLNRQMSGKATTPFRLLDPAYNLFTVPCGGHGFLLCLYQPCCELNTFLYCPQISEVLHYITWIQV